jgi:hypothetical protein
MHHILIKRLGLDHLIDCIPRGIGGVAIHEEHKPLTVTIYRESVHHE